MSDQELPLTLEAKTTIDLAYQAASEQLSPLIGTGQLLLAITRQPESAAARVLLALRAGESAVARGLQLLGGDNEASDGGQGPLDLADQDPCEYLAIRGRWPRDPRHGQARIVGLYHLPYFPDTLLLEALIFQSPDWVDFGEWYPYQPPASHDTLPLGLAHFYFDPDGRELIGSYLSPPPPGPVTRAGLLLPGDVMGILVNGKMLPFRKTSPIPERLLRLIWVEEGVPFQGPDQALGDDL